MGATGLSLQYREVCERDNMLIIFLDFKGVEWWTHDRMVEYNQPSDTNTEIANWLRENPHRLNLGNIGLWFADETITSEEDLDYKTQVLDMWTGRATSKFATSGDAISVETVAHPESSTVGISIESKALGKGNLGLFFDFPYPTHDKFNAPFVGVFNLTDLHTTKLIVDDDKKTSTAEIKHALGETEYSLFLTWEGEAEIQGPEEGTHRYLLKTPQDELLLTAAFAETKPESLPSFEEVNKTSEKWWREYWSNGAFLDLTASKSEDALEIQRRVILSQYLVAVNSASRLPPQESGT